MRQSYACSPTGRPASTTPPERLAETGVAVTNANRAHGPNIAEHVLGSLLVFARGLHQA